MFTPAYIAAMLVWASIASGIPIPADMPQPTVVIGRVDPVHGAETTFFPKTRTGTITFSGTSTPKYDACILSHELTHWLQFYQPAFSFNQEVDEPPAYEVQIKCLKGFGMFRQANISRDILEENKRTHKW